MRYFLLLSLLSLQVSMHGQELRVEPSNWWVGMKDQQLQLLVHGDNVGMKTVSTSYPGVTVIKVNRADSRNYLFVDLRISPSAKPGNCRLIFKEAGKPDFNYSYPLQARKNNRPGIAGFTAADVVYLITPDRFANGNKNNDVDTSLREKKIDRSQDYGRHGGDLRGIIDHLDYISAMGYTAIWPTPVLENNMPRASYHGYAITDFYKVDPRFGTLEEYIELADKARAKGIKLIFDGVVNHSGLHYWWMKDLPFKNWINYPDSFQSTNHRRTVNQDLYASLADAKLMVKGWFVRDMPDLNQENPFLAKYLIQNSIWWIETLGLGGIRQDTYPYSEKKFLGAWSCAIMNEYPKFSITGEEWSTNPLITSYWQQGKTNTTGYKGCLKSPMDFPLQTALVQALTESEGWNTGLVRLYESLANDFVYMNPQELLIFGDNHDMDRLFTQLKKDTAAMRMALGILLTLRGIPQLYYGTEVLLENSAKPGDHGLIRSDFPGGWEGDAVNGFTGVGLSAAQQANTSYLKKLLNWRKNSTVIHNGKTLHFAPEKGVYTYFRYNEKSIVMVMVNNNKEATMVAPQRFTEILKGLSVGKDIVNDSAVQLNNPIAVAGKSVRIIEIKR